jgi:hypothetical protein
MSGTVVNSASTPKVISIVRRPILSDSAPIAGCMIMYTNRLAAETSVASLLDRPTVFTRYCCMYVVNT